MNPGHHSATERVLSNVRLYDRTQINSWEDREYQEAVKATGRRKVIIGVLWTEAYLLFPTLDALKEGCEVYPVIDAVGGTTIEVHQTALRQMEQMGARPIT